MTAQPTESPSTVAPPAPAGRQHVRIQPSKGWQVLNLRQLWEFRELLGILVWRDIKVRYKQTVLGAAWAILQPFLTMVVFSIFFGKLAGLGKNLPGHIPYPVWSYCALLPWQLFAYALNESGNSLVANRQLITKVYFPRLVIPLSAVLAGLVDFCIAFAVLLGMMFWYGITPSLFALTTLPLFVFFAIATALSAGLWLSALNVEYRDVRYTIPFLTQFWLFLTPIAYPSTLIPQALRPLYGLNPMAGVVEGFRWALLGSNPPGPMLWVSVGTVTLLLIGGLAYFRRMEKTFADIV